MRKNRLHVLTWLATGCVFFVMSAASCAEETKTTVENLRCEYLTDPIGIDIPGPRLTWNLSSRTHGLRQTAYRIDLGTDSLAVASGEIAGEKTESEDMLVFYTQGEFKPFTKYYWKVTVWANDGEEYVSPVANFEMGMMDRRNWQGEWISDGRSVDEKPAPYFRKEILLNKKVVSARAYITSAGLYELSVNGRRVGDHHLDPMYTKFDKRTLYASYDVSHLLREGENAIGVILGNGWYNHQSTAVWDFEKAYWRGRPSFLLNVRVTYDDGSVQTFVTDRSWKTTDQGPVIFNSIYTAEHYDTRKEMPGWNKHAYADSLWSQSVAVKSPTGQVVSAQLQPVRVTQELRPVLVDKKDDSTYVFHFAKNTSGKIRLNVRGQEGQQLRLIHAERLNDQGYADISNIDQHYRPTDDSDPFQTDIVILSGRDDEFSPKFNYKGFQYVEVQASAPIEMGKDNLTMLVMHSDVPPVGELKTSNDVLQKMWAASNNSYLSNLFGYPTDCPQREKNGWTGDAHIAIETGLYNYDAITVYEKWMNDHIDEQRANGVLPAIIPTAGWGYTWANGVDWTSTIAIIPWEVYMFYGDITLLKRMYSRIKLYVDHITSISNGYLTDWGLGDWIPVNAQSNLELTTSCYYYTDADILAKTAALLGREEDAAKYSQLAENIRDAINDKYLDRSTGIYASGTQTELSVPLHRMIVPEDMKAKVAENLYKKVESDNFHLDVGLHGTKSLLNALSENGYAEAAYKVAAQTTYPSWGWWMVNGYTSFLENWRIDAAHDISLNHIMFGEVNAWMFKALGGMHPDEGKPGFKNVVLRPHFVDGLDSFSIRHHTMYGDVVSSWEKRAFGRKVVYKVTVPANCEATLYLPLKADGSVPEYSHDHGRFITEESVDGRQVLKFESGTYRIVVK